MSDKIELIRLCRVLQSNFFLFISQSESRTQPCDVRIRNTDQNIINIWTVSA